MRLFRGAQKKPGWLAIGFLPQGVCAVHVQRTSGARPSVSLCAAFEGEADDHALERLAKEVRAAQYRCSTLLRPSEYQMLLVESPSVASDELRKAIRWRIKDMLDYHVDDATIDVLDIPPDRNAPTKNHSMYAVAAPNQAIRQSQARFEQAKIPLAVIDIPEMAQRNISALLEPEQRGLALLSFDGAGGLLTVTYAGELYLARRVEITARQLAEADETQKAAYFDRITLEMQRSLDHFDRQYHFITLAKLVLAPLPGVEGLRDYLAGNLYLPVESLDLADLFDFSAVPELARPERQAQCFTTLGAALRLEEKAL
ncbi:MAG: agglutinin biogenesis protein MshI [Sulfuricella sp.]|nr:agglutinin biogenesis protein MshI [Sulfuricella sp.]